MSQETDVQDSDSLPPHLKPGIIASSENISSSESIPTPQRSHWLVELIGGLIMFVIGCAVVAGGLALLVWVCVIIDDIRHDGAIPDTPGTSIVSNDGTTACAESHDSSGSVQSATVCVNGETGDMSFSTP